MPSLHAEPRRVHSKPHVDWCEPSISPEDTEESYGPTEADEAWWVAYCAARAGEPGRIGRRGVSDEVGLRWARGTAAGARDREIAEARELGYQMGLISGISMAPGKFSPVQAAAYREGFALGLAEEDARTESLVELLEQERWADATDLTDADIYPAGCTS